VGDTASGGGTGGDGRGALGEGRRRARPGWLVGEKGTGKALFPAPSDHGWGCYALWVKRTLKLQLSPGTLLSVLNPDSGVTWKLKVLLVVWAQAVLPLLVFSGWR